MLIVETLQRIKASKEHDKVKDNDLFATDKVEMMTAHFDAMTISIFRNHLAKMGPKDTNSRYLLELMCKIYCIESLMRNSAIVFSAGYMVSGTHKLPHQAMDIMIKELRPQMIPLIEVQKWTDETLPSCIGNSYGDIYET